MWIASLVGISFYGGAISYVLFWGLTLLPLVACFYLVLVFFQFKIYQQIDHKTAVCKEPIPYFFVLKNESFFAFYSVSVKLFSKLSGVKDMVDGKEYQLLPGDEQEFRTSLVCKYRGEYKVGVKEVTVTDVFGLFRLRYKVQGTIRAEVLPRVLHLEEISGLKDVVNISYMESSVHPVEPDVITRDYVAGDALKWIHWKSSAKEQKLKTRRFLGERRKQIALVYDTKRYSRDMYTYLPQENQLLETVIALGWFLASKNIGFATYSGQKGLRSNALDEMNQFQSFYSYVSETVFEETEDLHANLQQLNHAGIFSDVQTLVMVAQKIQGETMGLLYQLSVRGVNVVLYLISDENTEEVQKLANQRIKIIVLPVEGDLEAVL